MENSKTKSATYKGSYITTIGGKRFHITFTHQFDNDGKMINEQETSKVELTN